jgi:hypothetical protein
VSISIPPLEAPWFYPFENKKTEMLVVQSIVVVL